jgi:hypothetical protein
VDAARGEFAQAATEAERLLAQGHDPKDDGPVLYAAARAFSLAARTAGAAGQADRAAALGDRAAELLARAVEQGFYDLSFQDHNRMGDDPALEAIRDRPRVRDLLAHRG